MPTIALDYDHTFTLDPTAWSAAILKLKQHGFRIVGATFRYPQEAIVDRRYLSLCDNIVYCSRESKTRGCAAAGEQIDVWIDDMPQFIEPGVGK